MNNKLQYLDPYNKCKTSLRTRGFNVALQIIVAGVLEYRIHRRKGLCQIGVKAAGKIIFQHAYRVRLDNRSAALAPCYNISRRGR
jgi:hypothetical protein